MNKAIATALLLSLSSLAEAGSCQVYVCVKQNGKIIPPVLQAVKKEECAVVAVNKRAAVKGRAYRPTFRSVQTAYKVKSLYIKRVIGCINIGGGNV